MSKLAIIAAVFMTMGSSAFANCDTKFNQRGKSAQALEDAMSCLRNQVSTDSNSEIKADSLIKVSYLHMFKSEFYTVGDSNKIIELEQAMKRSEQAILIYGRMFDLRAYEKLGETQKDTVAKALYFYGTATARYVEYKGKLEAIKKLSTIKRSMNTVIRLGREEIEHFGAHRTLAILNAKVPVIAGGNKGLAKKYFEIATSQTETTSGYSSYPLNNFMYAEYLAEENNKSEACAQLSKIVDITSEQIDILNNGYTFETSNDIKKAKRRFTELSCGR